jgi:GNAT superfamily N-acetyltransferase
MTTTIRPATPRDAPRIKEMRLQTEAHMEHSNPQTWRITPEGRQYIAAQIDTALQDPNKITLVAEKDTEIIAYAQSHVEHRTLYTPSTVAFIDLLHVDPAHRRKGVATQLVRDLATKFRRRGAQEVNLRYVKGNHEAQAFWTRLGLTPVIITANTTLETLKHKLEQ